ncbi:MAG: 3-deoxy-7-phosphoheptulonate synthase [Pseudomonadales bacterium]|nr:3-deoxy-7-phosphoheptulonate synthase [Pseudomonadales bacterium]
MAPLQLINEFPITTGATRTVLEARGAVQRIMSGKDDRLLVIVGPCSIHDPAAALDYASRLQPLITELREDLCIIMRVYFEKPRTTVGWKGLINDPGLDDSFRINDGLKLARHLLLQLADQGIPAGTEFLDLISPQYVADLVSWGAIGARTTESQCHRELASGLSCPVGFKNGTGGNLQIAIDAVGSATRSHHFLSVTKEGRSAIFQTAGNPDCHVILRGGGKHTNYDPESIRDASEKLLAAGHHPQLIVDCSHANSGKDHERQALVCRDLAGQIAKGNRHIAGLMLESNLVAGAQKQLPGKPLAYGQSITDACMGWDISAELLRELADAVRTRRQAVTVAA